MYYKVITSKGETEKVVRIQDARRIWKKYPDFVFLVKKKFAGRERYMKKFLIEEKITRENFKEKKIIFEKLIWKETKTEYEASLTYLHNFQIYISGIKYQEEKIKNKVEKKEKGGKEERGEKEEKGGEEGEKLSPKPKIIKNKNIKYIKPLGSPTYKAK